ncbi:hypothetical protein PA05_0377 [Cutibacterium acnes P05]|nr:hypothetical protein [Cutibacterium acnes P05]
MHSRGAVPIDFIPDVDLVCSDPLSGSDDVYPPALSRSP